MNIERLPNSLLNGRFLHCRPVKDGLIVGGVIVPSEGTPTFKVAIICPARGSRSMCDLRIRARSKDNHCLYWRGDSRGEYQIIGPNAEKIRPGLEAVTGTKFNSLQDQGGFDIVS